MAQTLELEFQVQEVKYRLADGTEVPARVVLKDEDLDLAFVAPQKPLDEATRAKIAVLPLDDAATQVEALDNTILINRTTDDFNYIPTLDLGSVSAVVSNPRTCYAHALARIRLRLAAGWTAVGKPRLSRTQLKFLSAIHASFDWKSHRNLS